MSVKRNLILGSFEDHFCALQASVNENVDRKVTLTDAITKIRELLQISLSINLSDYSVKISKVAREVQRLSILVETKGSELQTMPGRVDEASQLRQERTKLKEDKD